MTIVLVGRCALVRSIIGFAMQEYFGAEPVTVLVSVGLRIADLAYEINTTIKKEHAMPTKTDAIIIETAVMRIWVDYRRGIGGDEGLTFDVTAAGEKDGARILRFDCFSKTPHYHVGSSPKSPVHDMNAEGITDPVRWTLEQLKTRLPTMIEEAGYTEVAKTVDQAAIAQSLSRVEKDIFAKL